MELEVKEGDFVIAGSDGIFDNMSLGFMSVLINDLMTFPQATEEATFAKVNALCLVYSKLLGVNGDFIRKFYTVRRQIGESKDFNKEERYKAMKDAETDKKMFSMIAEQAMSEHFATIELDSDSRSAWMRYFEYSSIDLIAVPEVWNESPKVLAECVQNAIRARFVATAEQFKEFTNPEKLEFRNKILATAAKIFSELQNGYPNPFYIRAWMESEFLKEEGSGKPDDITVASGILVEREDIEKATEEVSPTMKSIASEVEKDETMWNNKFKIDISLLCEYNHKIALKRQQRNANMKPNSQPKVIEKPQEKSEVASQTPKLSTEKSIQELTAAAIKNQQNTQAAAQLGQQPIQRSKSVIIEKPKSVLLLADQKDPGNTKVRAKSTVLQKSGSTIDSPQTLSKSALIKGMQKGVSEAIKKLEI